MLCSWKFNEQQHVILSYPVIHFGHSFEGTTLEDYGVILIPEGLIECAAWRSWMKQLSATRCHRQSRHATISKCWYVLVQFNSFHSQSVVLFAPLRFAQHRFIPECNALISEINDKLAQPEIQPTEEARSIHARSGKKHTVLHRCQEGVRDMPKDIQTENSKDNWTCILASHIFKQHSMLVQPVLHWMSIRQNKKRVFACRPFSTSFSVELLLGCWRSFCVNCPILIRVQSMWKVLKQELLEQHQAILSVLSKENAECFRQELPLFSQEMRCVTLGFSDTVHWRIIQHQPGQKTNGLETETGRLAVVASARGCCVPSAFSQLKPPQKEANRRGQPLGLRCRSCGCGYGVLGVGDAVIVLVALVAVGIIVVVILVVIVAVAVAVVDVGHGHADAGNGWCWGGTGVVLVVVALVVAGVGAGVFVVALVLCLLGTVASGGGGVCCFLRSSSFALQHRRRETGQRLPFAYLFLPDPLRPFVPAPLACVMIAASRLRLLLRWWFWFWYVLVLVLVVVVLGALVDQFQSCHVQIQWSAFRQFFLQGLMGLFRSMIFDRGENHDKSRARKLDNITISYRINICG